MKKEVFREQKKIVARPNRTNTISILMSVKACEVTSAAEVELIYYKNKIEIRKVK